MEAKVFEALEKGTVVWILKFEPDHVSVSAAIKLDGMSVKEPDPCTSCRLVFWPEPKNCFLDPFEALLNLTARAANWKPDTRDLERWGRNM